MHKIYLHTPGIVSSLGSGIAQHFHILSQQTPSPLISEDNPFYDPDFNLKQGTFGKITCPLLELPESTPAHMVCRSNQITYHALMQIDEQIQQVIAQYGRQRVAVVVGTSTAGIDTIIPYFKQAYLNNKHDDYLNQSQLYFSSPQDYVRELYGLEGLGYGISTACTSGARAIMAGARLLLANLCDAVIVGGVDTLSPLTIKGFESLSVLSPQVLNPFSTNRQGTNIGEGAALFVLTRQALNDQAQELLGYGASSDAYHMSSPHPEGLGAKLAMEQALALARLEPSSIGWVNLHGTGTRHNDSMEALAVSQVLGTQVFCTSTKPYTAHTLGAAGAIEAAIAWAFISPDLNPTGVLPAQLWDGQPDPDIPQLNITQADSYWPQARRIALSNSFAFGGNNAVLILGQRDDHN
ncbi:beta-ketoacyl-ACP synthase [Psittacicella hinzii]|uniref:Beta-ketoacyl-[acyl-carrier-protein] synthase II n=1 Tax=Psittacicella hinzii TaxID=2028575 RepID=A0A3A1YUF8_9GAMM|nr:beta-ketoacyl-ACP synthase [Psittacicella hinzii]RIY39707.1 beta-ketoacyl-[acyl-carrier-protein] synthase II [Psittacicella hinzii]